MNCKQKNALRKITKSSMIAEKIIEVNMSFLCKNPLLALYHQLALENIVITDYRIFSHTEPKICERRARAKARLDRIRESKGLACTVKINYKCSRDSADEKQKQRVVSDFLKANSEDGAISIKIEDGDES